MRRRSHIKRRYRARLPEKEATVPEKLWVIYDERAAAGDTDAALVLESCSTLESVRTCTFDGVQGPLGVVAEYDIDGDQLINERLLGTVVELRKERR